MWVLSAAAGQYGGTGVGQVAGIGTGALHCEAVALVACARGAKPDLSDVKELARAPRRALARDQRKSSPCRTGERAVGREHAPSASMEEVKFGNWEVKFGTGRSQVWYAENSSLPINISN